MLGKPFTNNFFCKTEYDVFQEEQISEEEREELLKILEMNNEYFEIFISVDANVNAKDRALVILVKCNLTCLHDF